MAAAWRLGRWGALEGHLAHTRAGGAEPPGGGPGAGGDLGLDAEERWEVRLGRLLTAMHRRRAPPLMGARLLSVNLKKEI